MRLSTELLDRWSTAVSADGLSPRGSCRFLVVAGELRASVSWHQGSVELSADTDINQWWDFELDIPAAVWADFTAARPGRGHTSAQALVATHGAELIRGDRNVWARYSIVVDRVVAALRTALHGPGVTMAPGPPADPPGHSPIVGRYLIVDVAGTRRRLYYEQAGEGPALVCLHTAGADSRQYRYLMEDAELTSSFRVLAFDMPWHGRSDPPDDWQQSEYRLTTQEYAATVLAFMSALNLDQPILVGCSMGGGLACFLSSAHGDLFRGVCALEGGLGNPGRHVAWTDSFEADHSRFLVSWVGGLIAPSSPAGPRSQTLWGYAQSGPGVYHGDTYFYSTDLPAQAAALSPATCPLFVFSGEYDYSATTEMSTTAAKALGGQLVVMPGAGHFPMSEDPQGFLSYLRPVLAEIVAYGAPA